MVPTGRNGWEQHVAGIKHRRNASGARLGLPPGQVVVSVFEDALSVPSPRYKTKDPLATALGRGAAGAPPPQRAARAGRTPGSGVNGRGSGGLGPGRGARSGGGSSGSGAGKQLESGELDGPEARVQRLRQELLRETPAHVGLGPEYGRVARRFGAEALAAAWAMMHLFIENARARQHAEEAIGPLDEELRQVRKEAEARRRELEHQRSQVAGGGLPLQDLVEALRGNVALFERVRELLARSDRLHKHLLDSRRELEAAQEAQQRLQQQQQQQQQQGEGPQQPQPQHAPQQQPEDPRRRRGPRGDRAHAARAGGEPSACGGPAPLGPLRRLDTRGGTKWDVADVAALAGLMTGGALDLEELCMSVPCVTPGPHAAALTVALTVLSRALPSQPRLSRFKLRISGAGYADVLRQGGTGLRALPVLWGRALAALRASAPLLPALRELELEAPPGVLPPEQLQQLQEALAGAPRAARTAVLAGTHRRAGNESPLRRLPAEVLSRVLDLAVPRRPARLVLKLVDPLGLESSSSGGDGDDDDDDDDSSDDGSDDSSDDSGSDPGSDDESSDSDGGGASASGSGSEADTDGSDGQ